MRGAITRPVRQRGLRRRWTAAFAVLLAILLVTATATWLFAHRVVDGFGTAAARLDAVNHLTADLRREVSSQEHAGHAIINGASIDIDGFLSQQAWISTRFAHGDAVLHTQGQRRQLDAAAKAWRASLDRLALWGNAALLPRTRPTNEMPHLALATDSTSILARLDRLDTEFQQSVDDRLAASRRLENVMYGVLAALFLLAVGSAAWFWHLMSNDVLRPVAALHDAVADLKSGHPDARVKLAGAARETELGTLADAFDAMAATVRKAHGQRAGLLKRSLDAGEQERTRVANELHDGPIQRLAAMSYLIDAGLVRDDRLDANAARDTLLDVRSRLAAEVEAVRRLMADLRPPMLDQGGLAAGLGDYVDQFSYEHSMPVTLHADIGDARLDPAVETVAYRLVQEALTNVRRHARATVASVALRRESDLLLVTVTDDGIGFDRDGDGADHFGLAAMTERVASVGGAVEIATAPGEGTVIHARIPAAIGPVPVTAPEPVAQHAPPPRTPVHDDRAPVDARNPR